MSRDALSTIGLASDCFSSGEDALQHLQKQHDVDSIPLFHEYTVALIALLLPEISGYEVLRFMKNDSHLFLIPVVMIFTSPDTNMTEKCLLEGASDYLYCFFLDHDQNGAD